MREAIQNIYPVCSYGRAENLFFHAADSLCSVDLNASAVFELVRGDESPTFPSHILDREDFQELLSAILNLGKKVRIQVALGKEWQELEPRILWANAAGCSFDIIVDRALPLRDKFSYLNSLNDWRWVACPLRFYDLQELLTSLCLHPAGKDVSLCFFEPRDPHTLLLNPDEVILAKSDLPNFPLSVTEKITLGTPLSALKKSPSFYRNHSLQDYQESFVRLGSYRGLRTTMVKFFKFFPVLFSFFIYVMARPPRLLLQHGFMVIKIKYWHPLKRVLMLPLMKVYYFSEFQFNKRIRPYWGRRAAGD
jgi:hypothetical protein